jgi:hypothetical protein
MTTSIQDAKITKNMVAYLCADTKQHKCLKHYRITGSFLYMGVFICFLVSTAMSRPVSPPGLVRAQEAIEKLGDRLPVVALEHRKSPEALKALLLRDSDLSVDSGDRLLYDCSFGLYDGEEAPSEDAPEALPTSPGTTGPIAPYEDTFLLHSLPGVSKTIYLDFDGQYVSGTQWNSGNPIDAQPWDYDGDPSTFNNAERSNIQEIWARVAEDFSPFRINVTTEDPGVEALKKTNPGDTYFGVRVIFTITCVEWSTSCTGVAYLGSFDWDTDTPCWVFHGRSSIKLAAETASHEAGHTLSLAHDGTTTGTNYYGGHDDWAPIMGVSYSKSISQWSKGEYTNANNTEDDLAEIIAESGDGYRTDDHGDLIATATPLGGPASIGVAGIIETTTDIDVFSFNVTQDSIVTIIAWSDWPEGNLDLDLQLLQPDGTVIAQADNSDIDTELVSSTLVAGSYYIRIEGVGGTGYSDYASLGQYYITIISADVGVTFTDDFNVTERVNPGWSTDPAILPGDAWDSTGNLAASTGNPGMANGVATFATIAGYVNDWQSTAPHNGGWGNEQKVTVEVDAIFALDLTEIHFGSGFPIDDMAVDSMRIWLRRDNNWNGWPTVSAFSNRAPLGQPDIFYGSTPDIGVTDWNWHHIKVEFDGIGDDTLKIWIDGTQHLDMDFATFMGGAANNAINLNYTGLLIGTPGSDERLGYFDNLSITTVPEPATLALLGLGGLLLRRRRS